MFNTKIKGILLIVGGILAYLLRFWLNQFIWRFIGFFLPYSIRALIFFYALPLGIVIFGIMNIIRTRGAVSTEREEKIIPKNLKEVNMAQYKCVPAPKDLIITGRDSYVTAVNSFADIINSEATEGWKFYSMEDIAVTQKPGCLAGLFGAKETTVHFNMLIFVKE